MRNSILNNQCTLYMQTFATYIRYCSWSNTCPYAHIIVADSKWDSIIVNDFIANFSFTDVTLIVFLPSDWQWFHQWLADSSLSTLWSTRTITLLYLQFRPVILFVFKIGYRRWYWYIRISRTLVRRTRISTANIWALP